MGYTFSSGATTHSTTVGPEDEKAVSRAFVTSSLRVTRMPLAPNHSIKDKKLNEQQRAVVVKALQLCGSGAGASGRALLQFVCVLLIDITAACSVENGRQETRKPDICPTQIYQPKAAAQSEHEEIHRTRIRGQRSSSGRMLHHAESRQVGV